ncbi:MAG TPA: nickel-type superoxide dismutase maturation protease [Acidimicrobiales bacterium]|nr:nickel-type superoxide dismutase maturation protease [Acidimicrobiales bacterium]
MVCERSHPTHSPRRGWPAAAVLGTVAAAAWEIARRCRRLEVVGDSMLPSFEAGDRLLAVRAGRIRPGDVVAVPDPGQEGRLLVKRVHSVSRDSLEVRGDNDSASTDSRTFGPVRRSAVVGKIVYRYAPTERATWRP